MGKVQDYLKKKETDKKLVEAGLPTKVYVVESKPSGVGEVIEREIIDFKLGIITGSRTNLETDNEEKYTKNRYHLSGDEYPFEVDICDDKTSNTDEGLGCGMGDLWSWTYFCSFSKEEAEEWREKEVIRVEGKYGEKTEITMKFDISNNFDIVAEKYGTTGDREEVIKTAAWFVNCAMAGIEGSYSEGAPRRVEMGKLYKNMIAQLKEQLTEEEIEQHKI